MSQKIRRIEGAYFREATAVQTKRVAREFADQHRRKARVLPSVKSYVYPWTVWAELSPAEQEKLGRKYAPPSVKRKKRRKR